MNESSTAGKMHVLLVEDNEHDKVAFRRALGKSEISWQISECQKAEEALELLRSGVQSFDLVVIDFGLPGMSGMELFKRARGDGNRSPFVMLTGSGSENLAVEALKLGVADYVVKDPAHGYLQLLPLVLLDVIRRHEEKSARQRAERFNRILNSIGEIIYSTLSFDEIMQKALTKGAKALECETAAISLIKNGNWRVSYVHGFPTGVIGTEMTNEEELHAVLAMKTKEPVAISDAFNDKRVNRKHMRKWNIRSVLITPLIVKNEAIGVQFFNYHTSTFTFHEAHVDFALKLSASLALALENARLFKDLQGEIIERKLFEDKLRQANEQLEARVADRTRNLTEAIHALELEIVERQNAEKALRESEQNYSNLVQNSLTGIFIEQDGRIAFANERLAQIYGYPEEDLAGMEMLNLVHPEDRNLIQEITEKRLSGAAVPSEYDARGITKTGNTIWVQRRNAIIEHLGRPAILGNHIDVTKRKQLEASLRENEQRLKSLSNRILRAHEEERKRISRELHDGIGSSLTAIKLSLENLLSQSGQIANPLSNSLNVLISTVSGTIDETRRIMADLRPSVLDDLGLVTAIGWFCRKFQTAYPNIHVEQRIDIDQDKIPESLTIVVFRIIQEALHNVAKHSGAEFADLSLRENAEHIELVIEDNGIGFDIEEIRSREERGLGLATMQERAELSGGFFEVEAISGKGTVIRASWPCC